MHLWKGDLVHVYRCPNCQTQVKLTQALLPVPVCLAHAPCDMRLLPDTARALLPLDASTPALAPFKVKHLRAAGLLLPETQDALEWLYRNRKDNGMAEAFCKVGGRRCIDLVAFARLTREQRA
jgi:hypothetical protein